MNNFEEVDLAILGAGCAGLSLARELALRGVKQSVLILEPRQEYEDDRSWCFWSKKKDDLSNELAPLVSHSWPRWAFGLLGKTQESRSCQDVYYHFVRSVDFYKNCLATLEKCASIQLRMGLSVTGLTRHEKGWFVQCSDGNYIAKQVVDKAALARHQPDQRLHGRLEHGDGGGVGAFGCHRLELVIEGGVPELHQLVDEGVAVAEVVDESAEIDLGRRRQLAHSEAAQSLVGGDRKARIEQFLTSGVHLTRLLLHRF